jgi:glycosyltransferase involved in cell wall biosynthesis
MSERPRLLFVSCAPPHPLHNGARIRTRQLLTGLARSFDTVFLTYEHHPRSPDGGLSAGDLEAMLPGIAVLTAPGAGPGKRASQLRSLPRRRSWSLGRYATPPLARALAAALDSHRPQIVHFDDPGVGLLAPVAGALNVYASHNVERAILALSARTGPLPQRLFNAVEARKVDREEQRIWREVDLCLAVSDNDGRQMEQAGARHVELCPNGTEPLERLALTPRAADAPLRLLFVGSGSYAPYERGLAWMVRSVLPLIRAQGPVEFDVVGTPPAHPIAAEGVRYVGPVPSVRPFYERAHLVVVPVFEGSGTRLKMLEAAAYGRPVVSTRLGAEGLPLRAGSDYLQADDPADFAAALARLAGWWREPTLERLERLLAGAHAAVAPLAWPRIVERLDALYRAELEGAGR